MCKHCKDPTTELAPYWSERGGPAWACQSCTSVMRSAGMQDILKTDHFAVLLMKDPRCISGVDAAISDTVERTASGRRPINVYGSRV